MKYEFLVFKAKHRNGFALEKNSVPVGQFTDNIDRLPGYIHVGIM